MADNQFGLFWNSENNDRLYDADSMTLWLKKFFTTGVFQDECQVTSVGGMVVQMGTGYANMDGKVRNFDTVTEFTVSPANSRYPRIDAIVIERNDTNREITAKYVEGEYSGQTPVAPTPVRSGGVYQIIVATILVQSGAVSLTQADITDTRPDGTVCGWVTGTVDELDLEQILSQSEEKFGQWFEHIKGQLDTDVAGHLQNEIDELNEQLTSITKVWQYTDDDFNWYSSSPRAGVGAVKIGRIAMIFGVVDTQGDGSEKTVTIGDVPNGYYGTEEKPSLRPLYPVRVIQQANAMNRFMMTITTSGLIEMSKFGTATELTIPTSNTWTSIFAMYITAK